jgi:predicted TIM-barrel fold metal-dependent hydrolase
MNARQGGRTHRIDVHCHAIVPRIAELMRERGASFTLPWSLDETWQVMQACGIDVGVLSNPVPGDFFESAAQATRFCQIANDAVADLVREHPGRFGLLAALPMPYVDAALEHASYVFDELNADGVILIPHAADAYLGDALFEPLLAELDRRRAVVLVHPLTLPGGAAAAVQPVLADFLLDTTRGAISLITSGALDRYPDVSFVLAHAGGFLPYAAARIDALGRAFYGLSHDELRRALSRFHYDLALAAPTALPSLLAAVPADRILFGTDWCAAPSQAVAECTRGLDEAPGLDDRSRQMINRENALRLLPRLARRLESAPSRAAGDELARQPAARSSP